MFLAEQSLIDTLSLKSKHSLLSDIEFIIAIDEVGRGCVAGPVLTCASLWAKAQDDKSQAWVAQVKDSKKLTPAKRFTCFNNVLTEFNYTLETIPFRNLASTPRVNLFKPEFLEEFKPSFIPSSVNNKVFTTRFNCIGFCLGEGDLKEVEQFNIWNAVQIAASRALLGLNEHFLTALKIPFNKLILLIDGNKAFSVPELFSKVLQITAVEGDGLFISVGLSSILAKVYRDLFMESQEELYPHYGFAKHKGYGTSFHLKKIQEHGVCSLHRLSFLKNYINV